MQDTKKGCSKARELSSSHIRDYRKNVMRHLTGKVLSQSALAEKIGVSDLTIGRYERKELDVSKKSAQRLSELSGFIPEYWLGLTSCKTYEEYEDECDSAGLIDLERELELVAQRVARVKSLLNLCGYGYEDLSDGYHDFIGFSSNPQDAKDASMANMGYSHKITNLSLEAGTPAYLSTAELDALLSEISSMIEYTCYKTTKRNKP